MCTAVSCVGVRERTHACVCMRIIRKGGGVWDLGEGGSVRGRLLTNINSSLRLFGPNFERTLYTERILASGPRPRVQMYVLKEMASCS